MLQLLRKAITVFTLICFTGTTLVVSAGESVWVAPAPSSADKGSWAEHATARFSTTGMLKHWITMPVLSREGTQMVALPKDNWQILARATWNKAREEFNWDMIDGPEWITKNRAEFGKIGGLPPNAVMSDWIRQQPGNGRLVFAAYSPETLSLRIAVQKVEKLPNGDIIVAVMDFTPHHGRHWEYGGQYRTAAENSYDRNGKGYNPFQAFAGGDDDPVFHNISWSGAVVAIGAAIMNQKALFGFIAVDQLRNDTQQSKSGNWFRKRVTTTTRVYAKPKWWFAGPVEMVPGGQHHSICVGPEAIANPNAGCTDQARVANSHVLVSEWVGGNLPVGEDLIYQWSSTQKSWTVLFYTVIIALSVAGAGLLMAGAAGMGSTGAIAATAATGSGSAGLGVTGSLAAGAAAGGAYAAVSTGTFQSGSFTSVQGGFLDEINSGFMTQPNPGGAHEQRITQALDNKLIQPSIQSGQSLSSVAAFFGTECPLNLSVEQCNAAGQNPGIGWRTDSYMQDKEVLRLRNQYRRCAMAGYTGALLAQCAAPGRPDLLQAVGQ